VTAWTREALTYETMVRQGLSSRRPVGVTDAVRSVLALQAQEPAAPYLALWNRIDRSAPGVGTQSGRIESGPDRRARIARSTYWRRTERPVGVVNTRSMRSPSYTTRGHSLGSISMSVC